MISPKLLWFRSVAALLVVSMPLAVAAQINPKILHGLTAQNRGTDHNIKNITMYAPTDSRWESTENGNQLRIGSNEAASMGIVLVGSLPTNCILTATASDGKSQRLTADDDSNGMTMSEIMGSNATLLAEPIIECSDNFPTILVVETKVEVR